MKTGIAIILCIVGLMFWSSVTLADMSIVTTITIDTPWTDARSPAVLGGALFVGVDEFSSATPLVPGALQCFDVSDPAHPVGPIGEALLDDVVNEIKVVGNLAYLANDNMGLTIVDVSDCSVVGNYNEFEGAYTSAFTGLDVHGDYAYVTDHWKGLKVIDVSDPTSPDLVPSGTLQLGGYEYDVEVSGLTAFVGTSVHPLYSVDVASMPPTEIDHVQDAYPGARIALSGDVAYVAMQNDGLIAVDISASSPLSVIGSFSCSGSNIVDVAIDGNLAYLAAMDHGLLVLDISDPANPAMVDSCPTPANARRVAAQDGWAYVACDGGSVAVIREPLRGDLNGDGFVGQADLDMVLGRWGTWVLPNHVTQDLQVTTQTDWMASQLLVTLTNGEVYQNAAGGTGPPNPDLFDAFPGLEFDTHVDPDNIAGAAIDLEGGPADLQFDESGLSITWYNTDTDDTGTMNIARVTLSDDAVGTWELLVSANGQDWLVINDGTITCGAMTPESAGDEMLALAVMLDMANAADGNGNGFVSQHDLDLVLSNWGHGTPPPPSIPEPLTLSLLGLGSLAVMRRRRRRPIT